MQVREREEGLEHQCLRHGVHCQTAEALQEPEFESEYQRNQEAHRRAEGTANAYRGPSHPREKYVQQLSDTVRQSTHSLAVLPCI